MKVHDALQLLGQQRRFHVLVFTVLALNFMFVPIHIFVDLYVTHEPKHTCAYPEIPHYTKKHWIPNKEVYTDSYKSCVMYSEPLTNSEVKLLKKTVFNKKLAGKGKMWWDWKALKIKVKPYFPETDKMPGEKDKNEKAKDETDHKKQGVKSSIKNEKYRRRRRDNSAEYTEELDKDTPRVVVLNDPVRLDNDDDYMDTSYYDDIDNGNGTEIDDYSGYDIDDDVSDYHTHELVDDMGELPDYDPDDMSNYISDDKHNGYYHSHRHYHTHDHVHNENDTHGHTHDHFHYHNHTHQKSNKTSYNKWGNVRMNDVDRAKHKEHEKYFKKTFFSGNPKIPHDIVPCQNGIKYDTSTGETLVTEYNLSCKDDISVINTSVLVVAMVMGAVIFAPCADLYGRKTLFMMVWFQNCLVSLGLAFVGDIRSYWVLRFLSRFYIEGIEIAVLVLAVEMAPSNARPIAPLILYVAYAIGQVFLALQAYILRSWWKLQLAVSIETILLLPISWFIVPESVYWLMSMSRVKQAEKLIRLGCRVNGVILPRDFHLDASDYVPEEHGHGHGGPEEEVGAETDLETYHGQRRKSAVERIRDREENAKVKNEPSAAEYLQHEFHAHIGGIKKIWNLMKNTHLRMHFFIVAFMWATAGYLYYGLTTSTMKMKGNLFLNYSLGGIVMIPASISVFILRKFGRKKPVFYFLIGAGVSVILSVLCPYKTPTGTDLYFLYLVIKLLAKYFVVSCLISIRLVIIELFPTPVRGTLVGLTAFFGLLGSGAGYYYQSLLDYSYWTGIVVGLLTVIAAFLSQKLPETSNRPLPDTINDMLVAAREMFLNLLVAIPNMPQPPQQQQEPQPRPRESKKGLAALTSVLGWKRLTRSRTARARTNTDSAASSQSGHTPVRAQQSSPFPRGSIDEGRVPPVSVTDKMLAWGKKSKPSVAVTTPTVPSDNDKQTTAVGREEMVPMKNMGAAGSRKNDNSLTVPSFHQTQKIAGGGGGGIVNPNFQPDEETPNVTENNVNQSQPSDVSNKTSENKVVNSA